MSRCRPCHDSSCGWGPCSCSCHKDDAYPVAAERAAIAALPASGHALTVISAEAQDALAAWRATLDGDREGVYEALEHEREAAAYQVQHTKTKSQLLRDAYRRKVSRVDRALAVLRAVAK